jgi:hypothetical protein
MENEDGMKKRRKNRWKKIFLEIKRGTRFRFDLNCAPRWFRVAIQRQENTPTKEFWGWKEWKRQMGDIATKS